MSQQNDPDSKLSEQMKRAEQPSDPTKVPQHERAALHQPSSRGSALLTPSARQPAFDEQKETTSTHQTSQSLYNEALRRALEADYGISAGYTRSRSDTPLEASSSCDRDGRSEQSEQGVRRHRRSYEFTSCDDPAPLRSLKAEYGITPGYSPAGHRDRHQQHGGDVHEAFRGLSGSSVMEAIQHRHSFPHGMYHPRTLKQQRSAHTTMAELNAAMSRATMSDTSVKQTHQPTSTSRSRVAFDLPDQSQSSTSKRSTVQTSDVTEQSLAADPSQAAWQPLVTSFANNDSFAQASVHEWYQNLKNALAVGTMAPVTTQSIGLYSSGAALHATSRQALLSQQYLTAPLQPTHALPNEDVDFVQQQYKHVTSSSDGIHNWAEQQQALLSSRQPAESVTLSTDPVYGHTVCTWKRASGVNRSVESLITMYERAYPLLNDSESTEVEEIVRLWHCFDDEVLAIVLQMNGWSQLGKTKRDLVLDMMVLRQCQVLLDVHDALHELNAQTGDALTRTYQPRK